MMNEWILSVSLYSIFVSVDCRAAFAVTTLSYRIRDICVNRPKKKSFTEVLDEYKQIIYISIVIKLSL